MAFYLRLENRSSGEAYSTATHFDDNKDNCHRLSHAYCPLMNNNTTWTRGTHNMHFTGCSGAELGNVNTEPSAGESQSGKTPFVDVMTLTISGNNLGFANIARDCINQNNYTHNYGNYPDDSSDCFQAIATVSGRIKDISQYVEQTVQEVLARQRPFPWPEFHLFLTGYVKFFNADTTDCDARSFGAWPAWTFRPQPSLTQDLRKAINALIDAVNNMYKAIPSKVNRPFTNVHYVDIDSGFEGHSVCEQGNSFTDDFTPPIFGSGMCHPTRPQTGATLTTQVHLS